jgi:hypothetical protein
VFRAISMVEVVDGTDVDAIVAAGRAMAAAEPAVLRAEVMAGRRIMQRRFAEASYVLILDFEDEAAWRRYGKGAPHAAFAQLVAGIVKRITLAEYEIDG